MHLIDCCFVGHCMLRQGLNVKLLVPTGTVTSPGKVTLHFTNKQSHLSGLKKPRSSALCCCILRPLMKLYCLAVGVVSSKRDSPPHGSALAPPMVHWWSLTAATLIAAPSLMSRYILLVSRYILLVSDLYNNWRLCFDLECELMSCESHT